MLLIAGTVFFVFGRSKKDDAKASISSVERARVPAQKTAKRIPRSSIVADTKPSSVQRTPKPELPPKTWKFLKKNGLLAEPIDLVSKVFDTPVWTQISQTEYEHENGSLIEIEVTDARVTRVKMTFSPDLASAAMANVVGSVTGYAKVLPFHLEDLAMGYAPIEGTFKTAQNLQLRYRGKRARYQNTDKMQAWLQIELE